MMFFFVLCSDRVHTIVLHLGCQNTSQKNKMTAVASCVWIGVVAARGCGRCRGGLIELWGLSGAYVAKNPTDF